MKIKSVWLTRGGFKCGHCETSFDSPCMCGDSANLWYGEFLFYAKDGSLIYWNSLNDPIYDHFKKLLNAILAEYPNFPRYGLGMSLAILFDPSPDGSVYKERPYCPACKSDNTHYMTLHEGSVTLKIPVVTFTHWQSLSEAQQKQIIYDELEQVIARREVKQPTNSSQQKNQPDIFDIFEFKPSARPKPVKTKTILKVVLRITAVIGFLLLLAVMLLILLLN